MTTNNASGDAIAERVRAADISVGGSSQVEALLANALREQKPLADDGQLHDSVQAAENAASSFMFIPPGVFEPVTVTTNSLTILGCGYDTFINGTSQATGISFDGASNCRLENLRAATDSSSSNSAIAGINNATNNDIINCTVTESGGYAAIAGGLEWTIRGCRVQGSSSDGEINANGITTGDRATVRNCFVSAAQSTANYLLGEDALIANCISINSGGDGIYCQQNDTIIIGNRVMGSAGDGIEIWSADSGLDNIVGNNRIDGNISDSGTGTTLDSNLTGAAN